MPYESMSKSRQQMIWMVMLVLGLLFAFSGVCWSADAIGRLTAVVGSVDILRGGALPAVAAKTGDDLFVKDFLRTKSNSRAEIRFSDGNLLRVAARSRIDVSEYAVAQDTRTIRLSSGKVEAVVAPAAGGSKAAKRFEIHTPNAVAGVRGTWFFVTYEANTTGIAVKEGAVYAYNVLTPDKIVEIPAGHATTIRNGNQPGPNHPASDAELTIVRRELTTDGGERVTGLLWVPDGTNPTNFMPPASETNTNLLVRPAVEVGMTNMSGLATIAGAYDFQINITNARFFSSSASTSPTFWKADSLTGSWNPLTAGPAFNPVGTPVTVSGVGPNSASASGSFSITSWNAVTGTWVSTISGSGTINGSTTTFSGTGTGTGASNSITGSINGNISGTAQ